MVGIELSSFPFSSYMDTVVLGGRMCVCVCVKCVCACSSLSLGDYEFYVVELIENDQVELLLSSV